MDLSEKTPRELECLLIRFVDTDENWLQGFIRYVGAFNILETDMEQKLEVAIFNVARREGWQKYTKIRTNASPRSLAHKCIYRFRDIMQSTRDMVETIEHRPWEYEKITVHSVQAELVLG